MRLETSSRPCCSVAAFPHQDGDGYNIVLQALPIDGKIVLRIPKTATEQAR